MQGTPYLKGKDIVVTGACGTIGRELVYQLLAHHQVNSLLALDNNETEIYYLCESMADERLTCRLCDVRDMQALARSFDGADIVFHTAAYKHVILCEETPFEAVQTNIIGVQNIISAATQAQVKKVIFTSSDKAVNPTNVMGTSKLMGERLITAANNLITNGGPIFSSVRFGNVLGSRGSVIPIFRKQIARGGPVTLTDPDMTRFIMSIRQAVRCVIDAAELAKGGESLITKMPSIRIEDLVKVMINELAPENGYSPEDIRIETTGARPGEKLYEELMSQEETRRALELGKYFVVTPAFKLKRKDCFDYPDIVSDNVTNPYNSAVEENLTAEGLLSLLRKEKLLKEAFLPEEVQDCLS